MATAACVVSIQPDNRVEPERSAGVSEARIESATEAHRESRFDPSGEAEALQTRGELHVDDVAGWRAPCIPRQGQKEQSQSGRQSNVP
jgi:hypothetical protein